MRDGAFHDGASRHAPALAFRWRHQPAMGAASSFHSQREILAPPVITASGASVAAATSDNLLGPMTLSRYTDDWLFFFRSLSHTLIYDRFVRRYQYHA